MRHFTLNIAEEPEGGYVGIVAITPEEKVITQGETLFELLTNVAEGMELALEEDETAETEEFSN